MINLLPPEAKQSVIYARRNVALFQYCIVALTAGVALSAMLFFGATLASRTEKELEQSIQSDQVKVDELELINKEAKELANSIDVIATLLSKEMKFSELIKEIGAIIPPDAALQSLTLSDDQQTPLSLEVLADKADTIGVTQENIEESELFKGADVLSITNINGSSLGIINAYYDVPPPPAPVEEGVEAEATDAAAGDEAS